MFREKCKVWDQYTGLALRTAGSRALEEIEKREQDSGLTLRAAGGNVVEEVE